jgi:hypothetical protein
LPWALCSKIIRRTGRHDVRLYRPGYRPVVIEDVIVPSSGPPCNKITGSVRRRVTLELLGPDARVP